MALTIQERLKDLRVERGLTLEQLAEQTHLSKSALGSYEADEYKDISHYALIKLAKFYGVTADYLLGLTETKNHPNADLADLHLSDELIDLLKNGRIDTALFCELATHKDFVKLLADIEIYVNGIATGQIQNLNAWVDVARAEIMEKYQPGEHDKTAYLLNAIHVQEGEYFSRRVHDDIDGIMADMRKAHGQRQSAPNESLAESIKRDVEEAMSNKDDRIETLLRQALVRLAAEPLDVVWIARRREQLPAGIRFVPWGSVAAAREWATARVWLDNVRTRRHVKKKPGQYYLQTWHGTLTPKLMEAQIEHTLTPTYLKGAKQDSRDADCFISNNNYFYLLINCYCFTCSLLRNRDSNRYCCGTTSNTLDISFGVYHCN